jgi:hypothetical protein
MATWKDRVKQTVSAGGTGALTLGSAVSGYQALAAGDDGKVFGYFIEDGTAWESGYGIYTSSGTSFARTSRFASSTGSALNVTTSATVGVGMVSSLVAAQEHGALGVVPGGRLTLTTGVPVTTSDVTGATTIYYTPYISDRIALWDGNLWLPIQFSETSLALGTVAGFAGYDVFGYLSGGVLTLELLAWFNAPVTITIASPGVVSWTGHGMSNNDTVSLTTTGALPTGLSTHTRYWVVSKSNNDFQLAATRAGTAINTSGSQSGTHTAYQSRARGTLLSYQDGRLCKTGDKTRLYLGSFLATSSTGTDDSAGGVTTQVGGKRYLFNAYNDVMRSIGVKDTTSSWSYGTATIRQANGAAGNKVEFFRGLDNKPVNLNITGFAALASNSARGAYVGIGIDSETAFSGTVTASFTGGTQEVDLPIVGTYVGITGIGYHYATWLERGADGTCVFAGQLATGLAITGINGVVMA